MPLAARCSAPSAAQRLLCTPSAARIRFVTVCEVIKCGEDTRVELLTIVSVPSGGIRCNPKTLSRAFVLPDFQDFVLSYGHLYFVEPRGVEPLLHFRCSDGGNQRLHDGREVTTRAYMCIEYDCGRLSVQ